MCVIAAKSFMRFHFSWKASLEDIAAYVGSLQQKLMQFILKFTLKAQFALFPLECILSHGMLAPAYHLMTSLPCLGLVLKMGALTCLLLGENV